MTHNDELYNGKLLEIAEKADDWCPVNFADFAEPPVPVDFVLWERPVDRDLFLGEAVPVIEQILGLGVGERPGASHHDERRI